MFVHGALVRDGEWWWRPTARLLEERTGIRSRALALPSCGEVPDDARGLVADAAALRRALDDVEHAVVVGHSYGGTVIAEAGRHPAIAHLVLISSYLAEVGTTPSRASRASTPGRSSPPPPGQAGRASTPPTSSAPTTAAPRPPCSARTRRARPARSSCRPATTRSSPAPTSSSTPSRRSRSPGCRSPGRRGSSGATARARAGCRRGRGSTPTATRRAAPRRWCSAGC